MFTQLFHVMGDLLLKLCNNKDVLPTHPYAPLVDNIHPILLKDWNNYLTFTPCERNSCAD